MQPIAIDIARSMVCLCVGHTDTLCKNTAKSIEVPFVLLTQVGPKNYVLDAGRRSNFGELSSPLNSNTYKYT